MAKACSSAAAMRCWSGGCSAATRPSSPGCRWSAAAEAMFAGRGAWIRWFALPAAMIAGSVATPAEARAPVPFFGVVPQAPLEAKDWNRIGRAGLAVRLPVRWYEVEPRRGEFDFAALDLAMSEAAKHR